MSGGSYFHLFNKDVDELFDYLDTIEEMADCLDDINVYNAANETREIANQLRVFQEILTNKMKLLKPLWKAVEWFENGDSTKSSLNKAINIWNHNNKRIKNRMVLNK